MEWITIITSSPAFAPALACLLLVLMLGILFILLLWKFLRVGAESERIYQPKVEDYMSATCEYCGKWFEWQEDDALSKYKYGTKYIVHCPYCDKLTKVFKEN